MQEYDVALKLLLRGSAKLTMRELTGVAVEKWLDAELPKIQNLRLDLLGETADGSLIHLELHSSNEAIVSLRMAEYSLGIFRLFGKFPSQILLYVGEAPLRMDSELRGPDVWFRYRAIDIRTLDGDRLLESPEVGDNVIAILARLRDHKEAVVEEEARKVPILNSILDHEVLGREYKKGLREGQLQGQLQGELKDLRRLIEKRFGALPGWAEERLARQTATELEALSLRVLDAQSLEDLLK